MIHLPKPTPPPSPSLSVCTVHLPAAGDLVPALQSQGETIERSAPEEQDGLLYFRCGLKYNYKLECTYKFRDFL